jgi:molybdenum transport protein
MAVMFSEEMIDRLIEEDAPYGDLTTYILGIGLKKGKMFFSTREQTVLCCTEEAVRLLHRCGAEVKRCASSGDMVQAGSGFLVAEGTVEALHLGWRVSLNLLEYASGIATRTKKIVDAARSINPGILVATTRKSFPCAKKIAIKAILAGGALPHRLGLSETVLVFKNHLNFLGGLEGFLKALADIRDKAPERKIVVEVENRDEALRAAEAGVDAIQMDKMNSEALREIIHEVRAVNPTAKISVAGGINVSNAAEYAACGADILVMSSVYFGKPADMGVEIVPA